MLCVAQRPGELECSVTQGGRISSGKGINVPEAELKVDAVTERDWECVQWAVDHDIDFLAMSFVRRAAEITALHNEIDRLRTSCGADFVRLPIVAKIELPQAVRNIESIVEVADGIMVARGDLGVEMELARVPVIQKQLVQVAQAHGKPCIVATQMLQSMIEAPMPTRAEVSDVATAIFDGADAIMLSGETAVGRYPVLAVETMRRVSEETERYQASLPAEPSPPGKPRERRYRTAALAHGVWTVANDVDAKFIVVWSQQGGGARFLSQNNFSIPIIAMTSDPRAARQMQLLQGVIPFCLDVPDDLASFSRLADECLLRTGWARVGDNCILVAGGPVGSRGVTNSLAIHEIGSPETGYLKHGP